MIASTIALSLGSVSMPCDEGLVELQEVHRKVLQLGERGVAGPEVVDSDFYPECLEPPQNTRRLLGLLQDGVLGHFDAQALARDPVHTEAVLDEFHQTTDDELRRRHVDPDDEGQVRVFASPFGQLAAGLGEDPPAHVDHEAGLFGHRDERRRRQKATGRVLPADEGLDRQEFPGAQVDLGLVVQPQPVTLDGLAQRQFRA